MHSYAPRPGQLQHFLNAIPGEREVPLSANQIFNRQEKMRLPRRYVYEMLDAMANEGRIERVHAGFMEYYRKRITSRGLVIPTSFAYNAEQRNQFSLDKDIDPFLQALAPLRAGKTVLLWMESPQAKTEKKVRKAVLKTLVVISSGPSIGLPEGTVLISMVDKGSCVLRLGEPKKVAKLILAGMPIKLAQELTKRINHVFQGA